MGMIDAGYNNYMPNATECTTFNDIKKSHLGKNKTIIIETNDIYGMLILLGLGIVTAAIIFIAETITMVRVNKNHGK